MVVELLSVPSDMGHGANDGMYYPVGLLTIATHLRRHLPTVEICVVDLHLATGHVPQGDIVGISASSTLNYGNVLKLAGMAKKNGAIVVLGGPYASSVTDQILRNRRGLIDFVITGHGEVAFLEFIRQSQSDRPNYPSVPNLCWYDETANAVIRSQIRTSDWRYEDFLPLNFDLLSLPLEDYWRNFKKKADSTFDAVFLVFTHFGCGYKKNRLRDGLKDKALSRFCSYCALNAEFVVRTPEAIIEEAMALIRRFKIKTGAKILLKCYGDNMGPHFEMLNRLTDCIAACPEWKHYDIRWTFYMQSCYMTSKMAAKLKEVGAENLFIGFDSADDNIQRLNGMGTSMAAHRRCVENCIKHDIHIQAALMVGCAGETTESLKADLIFAQQLASLDQLERINTAVCVVMPGAPNYTLLVAKEPWIKELDYLDTIRLQQLWIKHFCPEWSENPEKGLATFARYVNAIDKLSPGVHSSMGYVSELWQQDRKLD